jgi:hypothetical protein
MTDVSAPTDMSAILTFHQDLIMVVRDSTSAVPVDTTSVIQPFVGITDNIREFIPIKPLIFTRQEFRDQLGESVPFWVSDNYRISRQQIDVSVEFICFQMVSTLASGNISVYLKYF